MGLLQSIRTEYTRYRRLVELSIEQVADALPRSIAHVAYHTGQIVYLARGFVGDGWQSPAIAKGMSDAYAKNPTKEKRSDGNQKTSVRCRTSTLGAVRRRSGWGRLGCAARIARAR
jgi:hypothetical protein